MLFSVQQEAEKIQAEGDKNEMQSVDNTTVHLYQLINMAEKVIETDFEAALSFGQKAQTIAEDTQNKEGLYSALIIQYRALKHLQMDSLAYNKLQASIVVKKALKDSTNRFLRESIRSKYQIKQKENEIALLRNEKEIHDIQLSSNKIILSFALPAFLLLLALLFILWKQYKRKKALQFLLSDKHTKTHLLNSELTHINKELIQSEEQLKQINETKNKFFSIVSQDLKSPLSSLATFLNNFIRENTEEKGKSAHLFVKKTNESVTSLSNLINNLLEWSRMQMGNMQYQPEKLDLKALILKNIDLLQPQTAHNNINIINDLQEDLAIHADKRMLGFVIRKLVSIYIESVEEHSSIAISSKRVIQKNTLALVVIKSGKVKDIFHDLTHVWEINAHYLQGSESTRNKTLGLVLCREFIEKHGGQISISEQELEKVSISFTLPLA